MLVSPSHLTLRKILALIGIRRGLSDLGNQISSGCFSYAVHKNPDIRGFQNNGESKRKAEEDTFSVQEPATLLLGGKADSAKVRFQLLYISVIVAALEFGVLGGCGDTYQFSH